MWFSLIVRVFLVFVQVYGGVVYSGENPWDLDAQTMIFRAKILVATPLSWDVASPCGEIYPLSLLELQPKECWDLYTWYSHGTSTTWARTQPRRRIWNCLTGVHWGCPCQQRSCIITVLPLNQLNQVESEILLAHLLNTTLCRCRKLGAQFNFNMAGPNETSNCGPASSKGVWVMFLQLFFSILIFNPKKMMRGKKVNVGNPMISLPFGDGLYDPFMLRLRWFMALGLPYALIH